MNTSVFDKDTLLDITVNVVPLGILAFFFVVFVVVNPWGMDDVLTSVVSLGLVAFTFLSLAVVTYFAAVRIETGE